MESSTLQCLTDLILFQDQFFCCFRESDSHQEGENGTIRILTSPDAMKGSVLSQYGPLADLSSPRLWRCPRGILVAIWVLAAMSLKSYAPILTLSSGGDCSYPGMVYLNGRLYISYYSSQTGQTCIYLAIVQL